MLYQLAVGRVPYNSDTPFSIIHDHIYTPLPMPRSINGKIPEDLELVLLKALAKDRNDRFSSVEELVDAFDSAARGISPWDEEQAGSAAPVALGAAGAIAEPAGAAAAENALDPIAVPAGATAAEILPERVVEPAGNASSEKSARLASASDGGLKKKPRRWAWVGGGLAFAILSIVSFGFVMSGSEAEPSRGSRDVAALDQAPQNAFEGPVQGAIPAAWQRVNATAEWIAQVLTAIGAV